MGEHWTLADGLYGNAPSWGSWHGGVRDLKTGEEYVAYREHLSRGAQHDANGMCVCKGCSDKRVERNRRICTYYVPPFKEPPMFVTEPADKVAMKLAASMPAFRSVMQAIPAGQNRNGDEFPGTLLKAHVRGDAGTAGPNCNGDFFVARPIEVDVSNRGGDAFSAVESLGIDPKCFVVGRDQAVRAGVYVSQDGKAHVRRDQQDDECGI